MAGRPSKLTPELQAKICNALRAGNFANVVCDAYGVDVSTYSRWMAKGQDQTDPETGQVTVRAASPWKEFRKAVEEAQAVPEVLLVSKTYQQAMGTAVVCPNCKHVIEQATEGDSRSREFILSRKFSERWAGRERVEHSGPDGGPIRTVSKQVRFGGRYKRDGALQMPGDPSPDAESVSKSGSTGE